MPNYVHGPEYTDCPGPHDDHDPTLDPDAPLDSPWCVVCGHALIDTDEEATE